MINILKRNIKIYHMASMARSGETLLLKIMNTHPNVVIVHNLSKHDIEYKNKAFNFFKTYYKNKISKNHNIVKPYNLKNNQILFLKQGVWKHKKSFNGFILSRNPVSIYSSLKAYDKLQPEYDPNDNFWFENSNRIERWMNDMDPNKTEDILRQEPVEQFCSFYNSRMGDLYNSGLPIVRYEDLVSKPKETLTDLCEILSLKMDERIIDSHKNYEKGALGHGQNDLSKPIDESSLHKYKNNVTEDEFKTISEKTKNVYEKYGYNLIDGEVTFI